jgi:hypothetical protein
MPLISMGSILTQRRKDAKTQRENEFYRVELRSPFGETYFREPLPQFLSFLASLRLCAFALNRNRNSHGSGTAQ